MSIKQPICYSYDLQTKQGVDLLAVIHIDDCNTEFLEIELTQGGEAVSAAGKAAKARFVSAKDKILIADDEIPVDSFGR